jgi:hypothetical protein
MCPFTHSCTSTVQQRRAGAAQCPAPGPGPAFRNWSRHFCMQRKTNRKHPFSLSSSVSEQTRTPAVAQRRGQRPTSTRLVGRPRRPRHPLAVSIASSSSCCWQAADTGCSVGRLELQPIFPRHPSLYSEASCAVWGRIGATRHCSLTK